MESHGQIICNYCRRLKLVSLIGDIKKHYLKRFVSRGINYCHSFLRSQHLTQPAFTCSKLTLETLEQGVKIVRS